VFSKNGKSRGSEEDHALRLCTARVKVKRNSAAKIVRNISRKSRTISKLVLNFEEPQLNFLLILNMVVALNRFQYFMMAKIRFWVASLLSKNPGTVACLQFTPRSKLTLSTEGGDGEEKRERKILEIEVDLPLGDVCDRRCA